MFQGCITKEEGAAWAKRVADERKRSGRSMEARRARLGL